VIAIQLMWITPAATAVQGSTSPTTQSRVVANTNGASEEALSPDYIPIWIMGTLGVERPIIDHIIERMRNDDAFKAYLKRKVGLELDDTFINTLRTPDPSTTKGVEKAQLYWFLCGLDGIGSDGSGIIESVRVRLELSVRKGVVTPGGESPVRRETILYPKPDETASPGPAETQAQDVPKRQAKDKPQGQAKGDPKAAAKEELSGVATVKPKVLKLEALDDKHVLGKSVKFLPIPWWEQGGNPGEWVVHIVTAVRNSILEDDWSSQNPPVKLQADALTKKVLASEVLPCVRWFTTDGKPVDPATIENISSCFKSESSVAPSYANFEGTTHTFWEEVCRRALLEELYYTLDDKDRKSLGRVWSLAVGNDIGESTVGAAEEKINGICQENRNNVVRVQGEGAWMCVPPNTTDDIVNNLIKQGQGSTEYKVRVAVGDKTKKTWSIQTICFKK